MTRWPPGARAKREHQQTCPKLIRNVREDVLLQAEALSLMTLRCL